MVWSTGGHGTAGRRVVKHGLYIFPSQFRLFGGAKGGGKGPRQQKDPVGTYDSRLGILYKSCENMHGAQARSTRRGPSGPTINILKVILIFNHFHPRATPLPPDKELLSERASSPQFWGGIHLPKSLLSSPYPAIPPYVVRTLHPGTTDDREHNTNHSEQREPWKPTERQGEARRAQESPGEPRGAPDSPGQPRRGEPRRTQGSPGNRC